MYNTEEDVRRALAKELGGPVRADIWARFVRLRQIEEILDAPGVEQPEMVADLAEEYRELDSDFPQGTTKKPTERREVPPDRRLEVLSDILAIEAARLPEVEAFRREVLGGQLFTLEEAAQWIERKGEEEKPATFWVKIPLPHGARPDAGWFESLANLPPDERARLPVAWQAETLAYSVPGDKWARRVPVRYDGALGRLKRVASALCRRYPLWQEAQAVAFILTGLTPALPKARIQLQYSLHSPGRIILNLDPRLSRAEVAQIYAKARPELFRGRDKPMSEKHLALAVFAARNENGDTWASQMKRWNKEHPEWAYSDWRGFARDVQAAWRKVTGRKWGLPMRRAKKAP